jgi:hypothetical protein
MPALLFIHVVISPLGIGSGIVVLFGFLANASAPGPAF